MTKALHVRNVEDEIVERLKAQAARNGRSTEAEHRRILVDALTKPATESFDELAAKVRALIGDRPHTPAEVLLRESRDER